MSGNSDYLNGLIINSALRGVAFVVPAAHYLALFTADPVDVGTANEANYVGYARVVVTNQWVAPSGSPKQTSNSGQAIFGSNGGVVNQVITHWGAFDASTGGNLIINGLLAVAKTIRPGDIPVVNAGDLVYKPDTA